MGEREKLALRKEQLRALGLRICDTQPARIAAVKAADEAGKAVIASSPMVATEAEFVAAEAHVRALGEVHRAKDLVTRILARMANLTARIALEENAGEGVGDG